MHKQQCPLDGDRHNAVRERPGAPALSASIYSVSYYLDFSKWPNLFYINYSVLLIIKYNILINVFKTLFGPIKAPIRLHGQFAGIMIFLIESIIIISTISTKELFWLHSVGSHFPTRVSIPSMRRNILLFLLFICVSFSLCRCLFSQTEHAALSQGHRSAPVTEELYVCLTISSSAVKRETKRNQELGTLWLWVTEAPVNHQGWMVEAFERAPR